MDTFEMLLNSCDKMVLGVLKCTVQHLIEGKSAFTIVKALIKSVAGHYRGRLFYLKPYGKQNDDRISRNSVLLVIEKEF